MPPRWLATLFVLLMQRSWSLSTLVSVALLTGLLTQGPMVSARGEERVNQLELLRRAERLSQENRSTEAAKAWQHVVDVNPYLDRAWMSLGNAQLKAKQYGPAIMAFKQALELRAGFPFDAAYGIACCHARLGEKEAALEWLRKALDLGFRNIDTIRTDEDLRSLRGEERFRQMAGIVNVRGVSRDDGWRADIDWLAREIKRTHYAPFSKVSRAEFDAATRRLRDGIPRLTDNQITVGCMKLLRLVGDGHTSLRGGFLAPQAATRLPVEFFLFQEGLFITSADPAHADLAGAEVLRVGSHTVASVLKALDAVVPQDNSMGLKWRGPEFLRYPQVLNGLDLIPNGQSATLTVRDKSGNERVVSLPANSAEPASSWASARVNAELSEPLYLKNRVLPYWFEYRPEIKVLYCQYNQVWEEGAKETVRQFFGRLFRFIDGHDVTGLVLDLRWNSGGNNELNDPLLHGLIRCDQVNQRGKLFVIVGRNTFSAAMCAAAQIERETKAIFVGEPTGSSPNFVGESAVIVEMPYSKLRASISDLYWQNSVATDYRTWIAPEIYVPPTFAAYRANRDSALEAILECLGANRSGPKAAAKLSFTP